jgi:hypothetical protein
VVAPAIRLERIPGLLAAPAMNVMERLPNYTFRQMPDTLRGHAYFGVSTRALGETLRFGAMVTEDAETSAPAVHDITMVVNDNDRTISQSSALQLVEMWRTHDGVTTRIYHFDRALHLPHDVVDVTQRCGMPEIVYPVLIALLDKRTPDVASATSARCAP